MREIKLEWRKTTIMLKDIIRVLLTPSCWIQNYPYSRDYDIRFRQLLENDHFTDIDKYYATIGGMKLWISNHPYASFYLPLLHVRPSRIVILKAKDKLVQDTLCQGDVSNA